jgi:hypothetical protein
MVHNWQKLGFVAKTQITVGQLPVWVENERMHIPQQPQFKLPF